MYRLGLILVPIILLACTEDVPLAACTGNECEDEASCGNGAIDEGEFCDDGNQESGDGCARDCRLEPRDNGEVGGASPTSVCGNDVREPTEQCDDANVVAGDGCSDLCTLEGAIVDGAYYVTLDGDDANDGRSEASAFRTIAHGVSQLVAGDTLYVKAGNYGDDRLSVAVDGSADAPVLIEGYRSIPGDGPRLVNFDAGSAVDASIMPLIDGGDRSEGTGIVVGGRYISVRNFQVTNFSQGAVLAGAFGVLDNIIARDFGALDEAYDGNGYWIRGDDNVLRNSVLVDAGGQGVTIGASRNVVEFCKAYGTPNADANGTNFFVLINGAAAAASDNVVRNNYIERDDASEVLGNGFSARTWAERNVFENNTAVAMTNGAFNAQHSRVTDNIFRNNTAVRGAIHIRAGATSNLFEGISVRGAPHAVLFVNAGEDSLNVDGIGGEGNTIRDLTLEDIAEAIVFFVGYDGTESTVSRDNVFEGIRHTGTTPWLFWGDHYSVRTVIRDSSFDSVENYALSRYLELTDLEASFENSSCVSCDFPLP